MSRSLYSLGNLPNSSGPEHRVYPYLLRNGRVTRLNQAWTADITYLPMARGFLYLVAIMDWHSRYVVAWRLSNSTAWAEQLNLGTGRYRVVQEHPIGKSDDVALFPAIAVPVETKHEYECPRDHPDCLRGYLPKITRLLLVGWRGAEQHFLGLLKESLPEKVPLYAVARDRQEAEEVIARVEEAGVRVDGTPAEGGFSEFVVSREAEEFLRS